MKVRLFIHPADNRHMKSGNKGFQSCRGSRVSLDFPENQSAAPMMSPPERRYYRKVATVSVTL